MVNASDCDSDTRGFNSPRPPSFGVSPSGKATDFDSVIRWFESSYPSKFCGSSSVVEYDLAKVGVAGSNPVFRSTGGIAKR